MPLNDYAESFIGKLNLALLGIAERDQAAEVPVTVFKQHYLELLETAVLTGELADFSEHVHIDPETGLLVAHIGLAVPEEPLLRWLVGSAGLPADTIEE